MSTFEPRTSVVTIYQGDYLDRIRHIERKYAAAVEAEKVAPTALAVDGSEVAALAAEHESLVKKADETAVDIKIVALGRKVWRALVAEHPPRDGNKDDLSVGVNEEAFRDPLVAASIVSPELTDDDLDQLSDVDHERLYMSCWALNRLAATAPKARLDSQPNRKNDETSN